MLNRTVRAAQRSICALCAVLASWPTAAAGAQQCLAVVEKTAGVVGFFAEDGQSLGQVQVGVFPHEAVLSKDGRLLYVADNGALWMTDEGEGGNTISIVDARAMKRIGVIDLGPFRRPHGTALMPGGKRLLVTTEKPSRLVMVDLARRAPARDYDVQGQSPHMVTASADGKRAFVSNTGSGAVAAIELDTGKATLIPTGNRPQGSVLARDGKRLYVVNTGASAISIIDTDRLAVVGSITTGRGPGRIAVTPDGKTLVYNLQFEPGVGFADVATGREIAVVPLSGRPLSLTMTRDGRRAFAGVQDQDKVFVISVAERRIERVVETPKGSGPDPAIPLEE